MPDHPEPPDRPVPAPREAVQRWRLVVSREALPSEVGQREQLQAWEAALAGSGLPVAGLDADPPRPRLAHAAPLSVSIPGLAELVDVWLTARTPAWRVRGTLGTSMPRGHALVEAYDVWLGAPALPGQVVASVYRATFLHGAVDPDWLAGACADLMTETTLPRSRSKGQSTVTYDLRPFLADLMVASTDTADTPDGGVVLRMTLRHDPERGIGRPDEALAALGERLGRALEPMSLVRETLVLAPPVKAEPAPRPGPRPGSRCGGRQSASRRRG